MTSNPYFRAFVIGALWFGFVAFKLVSREPGGLSAYPAQKLAILSVMWALTALSLGIVASRYKKLRSWGAITLATMPSSLAVMFLMLLVVERVYGPGLPPKFKTTDEMMSYFANETTKWVKKDRGIDLDYSIESTKIIEEELGRISAEVDKANPQAGTFGLATGYGAYVGEALRRKYGGSWSADHPVAGVGSYP